MLTHVHEIFLAVELRYEQILFVRDSSQRDVKSTGRDLVCVVWKKLVQCLSQVMDQLETWTQRTKGT